MTPSNSYKEIFRRFVEGTVNDRNVALADDVLAEDVVWHILGAPPVRGRGRLKAMMEQSLVAFPDLRVQVLDLVAEGDRVVARVSNSGTHTGDLAGLPATGRSVTWNLVHMVRFEGDRIAEGWPLFDQLDFLQQLGVLPERRPGFAPPEPPGR